jgi:hypothetical protein
MRPSFMWLLLVVVLTLTTVVGTAGCDAIKANDAQHTEKMEEKMERNDGPLKVVRKLWKDHRDDGPFKLAKVVRKLWRDRRNNTKRDQTTHQIPEPTRWEAPVPTPSPFVTVERLSVACAGLFAALLVAVLLMQEARFRAWRLAQQLKHTMPAPMAIVRPRRVESSERERASPAAPLPVKNTKSSLLRMQVAALALPRTPTPSKPSLQRLPSKVSLTAVEVQSACASADAPHTSCSACSRSRRRTV